MLLPTGNMFKMLTSTCKMTEEATTEGELSAKCIKEWHKSHAAIIPTGLIN